MTGSADRTTSYALDKQTSLKFVLVECGRLRFTDDPGSPVSCGCKLSHDAVTTGLEHLVTPVASVRNNAQLDRDQAKQKICLPCFFPQS